MRLEIDAEDLRPIIAQVAADLIERFGGEPERLAYPEARAAELLGVPPHVLRDARLRGQIQGSKVGRGVVYGRAELLRFLDSRRGADDSPQSIPLPRRGERAANGRFA